MAFTSPNADYSRRSSIVSDSSRSKVTNDGQAKRTLVISAVYIFFIPPAHFYTFTVVIIAVDSPELDPVEAERAQEIDTKGVVLAGEKTFEAMALDPSQIY